jgi:hypothetical protein
MIGGEQSYYTYSENENGWYILENEIAEFNVETVKIDINDILDII